MSPVRMKTLAAALGLLFAFDPGDARADTPADTSGAALEAAAPTTILYQGRLTLLDGSPRVGPVTLTFRLYVNSSTTTPLWTESHPGTPLTDGVFSVLLGSLNAFPANAWSDAERWLGVTVEEDPEMTPRLRIASVPFAIESNRLNGKRSTDFEPAGAAAIAAAGLAAQLNGSDGTPPNEGSNQVNWSNLFGVPSGIADGVDNIGDGVAVHGQLQGLEANDHPQYALNAVLQGSDGNAPNIGTNRVHWDNLGGMPQPLAENVLPAEWIEAGSIDSVRIGAGAVATSNLAPGSVTSSRIATGAVGSEAVADNGLTGDDIQNGSLTGDDVLNGTLSGLDLQDGSLFTIDIANGSILGVDIAAGAVGADQVEDGALPGSKLQDGTVPGLKLQAGSVDGSRITPGAIGANEIATGAVTGEDVQDGSVNSQDLLDEPGLTWLNVTGFVDTVTSTTGQTIGQITITVPDAGYVVVTGRVQVFMLHDTGFPSRAIIAVSDMPDMMETARSATLALPAGFPSEVYLYPLEMSSVFQVPSAGPYTFYLTARKGVQPRLPSMHDLSLRALYVRSQY